MDENTNFGDHFQSPQGRSKIKKALSVIAIALVSAAALAVVAKQVSRSDSTEQE